MTKPRGRPYPPALATAQKWATKLHVALFRRTNGRVGGHLAGGPILLLDHTGRKSGRRRTTPLLYMRDGEDLVVVASNGGAPRDPAWWLNLKANPEAMAQVGERTLRVRAQEATGEEKRRLWERLVRMYPPYEDYRRRTNREIPVVILRRTTRDP